MELRHTYCGTPLYLSPEMLKNSGYDEKIDIWAIGIIAYELKFGSAPFCIQNSAELNKIVIFEFNLVELISQNLAWHL